MESRQRRARQEEVGRNDRALLEAARRVFARDGVHTSVAAIAEAAGVGMGTLYRRYEGKAALLERLLVLSNEQWADAVRRARSTADAWQGLAGLVMESVEYGQGTLAPPGQLIAVPPTLTDLLTRADEDLRGLVDDAHASGDLSPGVTAEDIVLLIEQLGRSPLVEQIGEIGDAELLAAARAARRRLITIALNGLTPNRPAPLPGPAPRPELLSARWPSRPTPART